MATLRVDPFGPVANVRRLPALPFASALAA